MRGAGRPAASAAAVMRAATCSSIAAAVAIQRTTPSACSPATRRSRGDSADRSTGTGCGESPILLGAHGPVLALEGHVLTPEQRGEHLHVPLAFRPGWS